MRFTLALRRLSSDAPALGSEEKRAPALMAPGLGHRPCLHLRAAGQRGYAPSCPTAYARPLGPAAILTRLTIADSTLAPAYARHLATGEQVAQWFGPPWRQQ